VLEIAAGKAGRQLLEELAAEAEAVEAELPQDERRWWRSHAAEAFLEAGLDDRAVALARNNDYLGNVLIRAADRLAARKLWARAADLYALAAEQEPNPRDTLALYLRGRALLHCGRADEGRQLMAAAHLLPLGDNARGLLAEGLAQRGLADSAEREWELLDRTCAVDNVRRYGDAADRAERRGDFAAAAKLGERYLFLILEHNATLFEDEGYLRAPHQVHLSRARGLAAAGHVEEAMREARLCQAALPCDMEMPIALVPALEKLGRSKEAEEILATASAALEAVLADYPRSAGHHNSLAWLWACCNRRLDAAMEHARRAVELKPDEPAFLDTLAEVHFRQGNPAKAVELQRRCVEMAPENKVYRERLERFEKQLRGPGAAEGKAAR